MLHLERGAWRMSITNMVQAVYDRNVNPTDLPVERITHLIYSFAKINGQSGEV